MKKFIPLSILMIQVILVSCVRSLYPISENENNLVFKKELLGHWIDKDSAHYGVDTIQGHNGKIYRVAIVDPKKSLESVEFSDTSFFIVSIANVKGRLFLDCYPEMERFANKNLGESAAQSVLPTHFIMRLSSVQPNSIELASIDKDKFLLLLNQKKFSIRNELIDKDNLLLTEKPLQLQQKLIEMEKFPSVFSNETLTRLKN
jgi:hypothetical protein